MGAQVDLLNDDQQSLCDGILIGAVWEQFFEWRDANNDPVDISGFEFRMGIKDPDTEAEIIELTSTDPIGNTLQIRVVTDGTNGQYKFFLTTAETAALSKKKGCKYDLFYDGGDGWRPLFGGIVDITLPRTDLS